MTQKSLLGNYSDPTGTYTFTGLGLVPIGAVIPIANSAAWSLPAAGEIKDGYALCNGSSFPAGSHASLTGTMPNLSDERFLQGSTSSGTTGGSTEKNPTFNKTEMNTNQTAHAHGMDHRHIWGYTEDEQFLRSWNDQGGIRLIAGDGGTGDGNVLNRTNILNNGSHYTQGSVNNPPGTTGRTDTDNANVSWTSSNVTVSISDIRPKYLNVVYVMRVV